MRESHQVFKIAHDTSVSPNSDPHPPIGERMGRLASCSGVACLRKEKWAASDTSHESIRPNNAPLNMYTKAFAGAHFSRTNATTIPYEEPSNANFGAPAEFNRPNSAGAHPVRANENSIRDAAYRFAFAPESAAVSITKLTSALAAGILTDRKVVTNGLSATPT